MNTNSKLTRKQTLLGTAAILAALIASSAQAADVAWWRFEEGPLNAQIPNPIGGPAFYPGVADSSGNGNTLSVWDEGGAGYKYTTDLAATALPLNGTPNLYSVVNTGGGPAMYTETGGFLQTWTPSAWTVEVAFQNENGGWRTLVGRDSQGAATQGGADLNLAAMYLQITPDNQLAIKFCDVGGYWHEAISTAGLITGYDWGTDPTGSTGLWKGAAAVSDGSTLSLYYRNIELSSGWQLVAQTDLLASGSSNTALTPGTGDGGDWDAGNFTVGRGLYNGGHGDRAYGFIDEVRLSDTALDPSQFLFVPEPSTLALTAMGFGFLLTAVRRRRNA